MKRIKEKFKRTVKYWHISYQQASGRDRMVLGMVVMMLLAYAWLAIQVF